MAVAATEQSRIGATVAGKYRLARVLGRGGMGVVYEAEHLVTNRRVAIKVMHPENELGSDAARRFMNEASAAGRIQHPNVVEVLDAGQDAADGSLFIVLELLTGIDLATYLMRYEKLLPAETLTVVCQVLQALVVAGRVGIVHRDIKPENIFLARQQTGDTHVKVVDFGISKAIHPDRDIPLSITRNNTTVGTPHYMSPEQAKGEAIDTRADLWALGVVMYECLTGRLPFDGENFNLQIVAVVTGQHPPATDFGVDPELSALIDTCLEKDREQRFAHAAAMLGALRAYVEKHPDLKVRSALLKEPPEQGPAIPMTRPDDPTTSIPLDPSSGLSMPAPPLPPGSPNTDQHLPVFPGMVRIDEEHLADNAPTTVRAIVSGGAAPRPQAGRRGARPLDPDVSGRWQPSRAPRGGVLVIGALFLVAMGAGAGFAVISSTRAHGSATMPVPNRITLRFVGIHPGARVLVGATPYYSETAFVQRRAGPLPVHVEAPGFLPLDFTIVPDRDQNIALPAMQPTPPSSAVDASVPEVPAHAVAPSVPAVAPIVHAPPPSPGTLSVGANPRCVVSVDGRVLGSTPLIGKTISAGPHRVGCTRPGVRPTFQNVRVLPGTPARLIF